MNRTELQRLSDERIDDAKALLSATRWAGAYYLAGYSLECALKSCVLAYIVRRPDIIFEDKKYAEKCWTHNLETLVKQADLSAERERIIVSIPELAANWLIAKDWSEISRYQLSAQPKAEELFAAITDEKVGVLQWVKNYW